MAHGGKRRGAGRKLGAVTRITAQARKRALESGISPLDYMLKVMRNAKAETKRRDDMAKAAAPFCHTRAIEHSGPNRGPITTLDLSKATDEQISALEAIFGPLAESGDSDGGGQGREA
jgi:hypothetical protein